METLYGFPDAAERSAGLFFFLREIVFGVGEPRRRDDKKKYGGGGGGGGSTTFMTIGDANSVPAWRRRRRVFAVAIDCDCDQIESKDVKPL